MAQYPFYVLLRSRGLSARELQAGRKKFPNREDTGYCSLRCVPAGDGDDAHMSAVSLVDPDSAFDASMRCDRTFHFDDVMDERASNQDVYDRAVAPLVDAVRGGVNATCFAYGMTGAGKTYTMLGETRKGVRGICSLAASELFDAAEDTDAIQSLHVSYLEIYNERLRDLLSVHEPDSNPRRLDIVEDPERGIAVTNLSERLVTSVEQLELLVEQAAARRVMASTASNVVSSRSHALLQIVVRRQTPSAVAGQPDVVTTGRLQLIDLAGSERAGITAPLSRDVGGGVGDFAGRGLVAKQQLRRNEGSNINKSLLALGACITALGGAATGPTAMPHVPYRDSKLTRLLKDSLGGNTRTAMIAAVSPSCLCYDETLATLKYATKARHITHTVKRNATTVTANAAAAATGAAGSTCFATEGGIESDYNALIVALSDEVSDLRAQVAAARGMNERIASASSARSSLQRTTGSPSPGRSAAAASAADARRQLDAMWQQFRALEAAGAPTAGPGDRALDHANDTAPPTTSGGTLALGGVSPSTKWAELWGEKLHTTARNMGLSPDSVMAVGREQLSRSGTTPRKILGDVATNYLPATKPAHVHPAQSLYTSH